MADNDPVEWILLDDDFSTVLGILPASDGNLYIELNEPGSGSLRIPIDSPIASQITEGQFIRCNYRGASRGGFFVDIIRKEEADANEGGGRWLAISGRGTLGILDDAIIWDDGTGASKRTFSGTKAGILATLISENVTRGVVANVVLSFDATEDTNSVSWTDDEDLELTVGRSLLDTLREFSDAELIDFDITIESNGDFTLNAYKNGVGTNKSSTIYFRVGVNCEEVREERVGTQVKNDMLIKYKGGFIRVSDSTSANTYRRRAKIINIEAAQTAQSASTFGAAQLEIEKDPRRSIPISVYDGVEPNVFLDYILGDYVTLDRFGTETSDRIVGLQLSFDDSGIAHVIISLNDIIAENGIKFGRDLEWLLKQWNTARDSKLLEARFWAAIGLPTDSIVAVHAMHRSGDTLYVAGEFSTIGGVLSPGVIRYNIPSASWSILSLSNNFNDIAYAVLYHDGVVYGGGNSSNVYAFTTSWTAVGLGSAFSSVYALATDGTDIYAGGDFTDMNSATGCVALYDISADTWVQLGTTPSGFCYSLLWHNGELWAGGTFGVSKWNGSSWSTVGTVGGTVYALASRGSEVIAGGSFTGGVKVWDGSSWELLGGGVNATVRALTVFLTDVYVGGEFTDVGNYVARYNGVWDTLDGGANDDIYALAIDDNQTLFAGGIFSSAGGKSINKIGAYYVSFNGLLDYLESHKGMFDLAAAIHGATEKTSMAANDEFGMWDSISGLLRKIKWSNILLSIKTYTDGLYVALTGNQTVGGVKTFSSFPVTPSSAPTTDYQVANKKYVDDNAGGGGTPGGSDTEIQVNNAGAFAGYPTFVRQSNGAIVIGDIAPGLAIDENSIGQGADDASIANFLESFGTSVASFIALLRARGTHDSPEAVQSGDVIGRIRGRAHDGSAWSNTQMEIRLVANENWSSGNHGARIEIYTTPDGSDTLTLAMTITEDGHVEIAEDKEFRVGGIAIGQSIETSGRLTLQSGVAIPTTEQSNKTTLYFTPYKGNKVSFLDGIVLGFSELSLDMSAYTKNCRYDIFRYNNSGAVAIEGLSWGVNTEYNITAATAAAPPVITFTAAVGTNPFAVGDVVCIQGITGNMGSDVLHGEWAVTAIGGSNPNWTITLGGLTTSGKTYTSGGTIRKKKDTRSTDISITDGIYTKDGDTSRIYLGTVYIDGNGYCQKTILADGVWNYYNRTDYSLYKSVEVNHTYNSTTYRYYNNDALQHVYYVCGVAEDIISASISGQYSAITTGTDAGYAGIAKDNALTASLLFPQAVMNINGRITVPVFIPTGIGMKKLYMIQAAVNSVDFQNYIISLILKS